MRWLLGDDITLDRLNHRQGLLATIDQQRRIAERAADAGVDAFKKKALSMLSSPAARQAFDLAAEPDAVRDRYGRNIHGQSVLLARRLIEHGVSLVSVNWHNDGRNFWDTHGNNFNRLKDDLIPPADQALSALVEDLASRGMLDETIVAWVGEFGAGRRSRTMSPAAITGRAAIAGCWLAAAFAAARCTA